MIYQQQTVAADAPATKVAITAAHGLSSSCSCAAVAAMAAAGEDAPEAAIAAASSGSYCSCAAVAAMVAGEDAEVSAKQFS